MHREGWLVLGLVLLLGGAGAVSAQTVEYYHLDALGSVRAVTDEQGAVKVRHDFLPFGEEWDAPTTPDSRRFTGKERDAETGLDYFGARYYRADIGRFTTIDPVYAWQENLVDPQRWNRYAYARNNPLKYVDPDGRWIETLWDIANVVMGAKSAVDNFRSGKILSGAVDTGGAIVDLAAAVIPVVPGGVGTAIKAARAVDKIDDGIDAARAVARTELHHAWPKYLGGPGKQVLAELPQDLHREFHAGLDRLLPRQLGADHYRKLTPTQQAEQFDLLRRYIEAFDKKHKTELWDALKAVAK